MPDRVVMYLSGIFAVKDKVCDIICRKVLCEFILISNQGTQYLGIIIVIN